MWAASGPVPLYAALYPEQQPFDGARIPTLAAVYDLDRDVRLTIEIKSFPPHPEWTIDPVAMTDRVIAVVDAADAIGRTLISELRLARSSPSSPHAAGRRTCLAHLRQDARGLSTLAEWSGPRGLWGVRR